MADAAEAAAVEAGVLNLPPEVLKVFGRLRYRTSYGQNVMRHSVETAHIAAMIAREIGADVDVARAGGFLHDLGKAVSPRSRRDACNHRRGHHAGASA